MADVAAEIEALQLRFMRAWVAADSKEAKKLLSRDFTAMIGTLPPQLLDRPSFLVALERGFACTKFALREVYVRRHGKAAWLVAGAELELRLGGREWTGPFLLSVLWRKGAIGGWKLAELSLAPLEQADGFAAAVAKLQLWK
jgi:ketosteroid isomerase-like protein